jgi:ribosomal protein S12 methylthiotransferase
MKHINIVTLGCSKNLVDSEKILGQLKKGDYKLSHDADGPADIVIINTCGFINDAKEESIDTILQYTEAKKKGLVGEVIVTGCLSQRYRDELKKEIPEADAWFGVKEPAELFSYLNEKFNPESQERVITTPAHYAYLKVAEGCDRTCSFCAIPLIRGGFMSRPISSLVEEAKQLAREGVKELLLIAQDLSYYGYDIAKRSLLADLLKELVKIEGIEWIRLHYAYPKNFPREVISLMAKERKICKYLDIPLQHISDEILSSMRRNTTREETINLLNEFRSSVPDVAIRTTLLVGYPGESRKHFDELAEFVKAIRFERLGVFIYSPEEGTRANEMNDNVSEKEKSKRAEQIMELQQEISLELNSQRVGKVFRIIIDREEPEYYVGRTEYDSPEVDNEVLVKKTKTLKPGDMCDVKVDSAAEFEIYATII